MSSPLRATAISAGFLAFAWAIYDRSPTMAWVAFLFAGVPVIVAAYMHLFFTHRDPAALRSESHDVRARALEIAKQSIALPPANSETMTAIVSAVVGVRSLPAGETDGQS